MLVIAQIRSRTTVAAPYNGRYMLKGSLTSPWCPKHLSLYIIEQNQLPSLRAFRQDTTPKCRRSH